MIELLPARYSVRERIGSGGMGQVYRAHDTKLGRDVAVKLLPSDVARDRERLERLRREARVLAHLGHAHIASVYDLEEADGHTFLILEYVPGATLAERIARGPMPVPEALPLFKQLAEAIGAAHERGVIHRDLKPANVIVDPEGRIKVLDFGIAKALHEPSGPEDPWAPSGIHVGPTATGALAGTVGYMSPEQVRGQALDRRTDIWAFGCLMYEVLTGKRAFRGDTVADTHAQVLERDPDWGALPAAVPPRVRALLERCLARDPQFRTRDMGDVWIELDAAIRERADGGRPAPATARIAPPAARARTIIITALASAGVVALAAWALRDRTPRPLPVRFRVDASQLPEAQIQCPWIALSPDGSSLVYATVTGLSRRRMTDLELRPLSRRGQYFAPFFSPDGSKVGCSSPESKLVWFALDDSMPTTIISGVTTRGACWGQDDSILYAPSLGGGLWKVSVHGGDPRPVTTLDSSRREMTHRWPHLLPGGRAALFTVRTADEATFDKADIAVVSLATGKRWTVVRGGTNAHYLPTGHIVFARDLSLLAVPFDLAKLKVTGEPVRVLQNVSVSPTTGAAGIAFARNGTMAYAPVLPGWHRPGLVHMDARGDPVSDFGAPGIFEDPRFSPDGQRVVFTMVGAQNDIAIHDFGPRTITRLTFDAAEDMYAVWTPGGREITFASARDGPLNLYQKPADGSREEVRITRSEQDQRPDSWSPDGRLLFFTQQDTKTGSDIWIMDRSRGGECRPWLKTPASESSGMCSPDGRWVAYTSDESGVSEVYVQSLSGSGGHWQVSRGGGSAPRWSGDGHELAYSPTGGGIVLVHLATSPTFHVDTPAAPNPGALTATYDLSPRDGSFIFSAPVGAPNDIIVTTDWFRSLRAGPLAGR